MSVVHLGSKTLGAFVPGVQTIALPAILQYLNDLVSQVAALTSQLSQYAELALTVPDPLTLLASLESTIATLLASLATLATSLPTTIGTASLDLTGSLGALRLQLAGIESIVDQLKAAMSAGGIHAFSIDSTPQALAGEIAGLISGGMPGGGLSTARVRGSLLLTESPASAASMGVVLATT